jgi:alkylhydroperoxidase family enzyme
MPRIPKLEIDQAIGSTKEIFDKVYKERGNVPNMFRTVAHRPEILRTLVAHMRAIMEAPGVSAKLKELVIVRTSQINNCEY